MKPIKFSEQNVTFTKPDNMTDEECSSLPVFQNDSQIISCWQLDDTDRQRLLDGGVIWLHVIATFQPPVLVSTDHPFQDFEEWAEEISEVAK